MAYVSTIIRNFYDATVAITDAPRFHPAGRLAGGPAGGRLGRNRSRNPRRSLSLATPDASPPSPSLRCRPCRPCSLGPHATDDSRADVPRMAVVSSIPSPASPR